MRTTNANSAANYATRDTPRPSGHAPRHPRPRHHPQELLWCLLSSTFYERCSTKRMNPLWSSRSGSAKYLKYMYQCDTRSESGVGSTVLKSFALSYREAAAFKLLRVASPQGSQLCASSTSFMVRRHISSSHGNAATCTPTGTPFAPAAAAMILLSHISSVG